MTERTLQNRQMLPICEDPNSRGCCRDCGRNPDNLPEGTWSATTIYPGTSRTGACRWHSPVRERAKA